MNLGPVCGYPLGLTFNYVTGELYMADAYRGLLKVGPDPGMLATPLATAAEGVPFAATNSVDFDPLGGIIYFTDSSTKYQIRNYTQAINSNDTTGRLMKYELSTQKLTVLARGLGFANGVAVSSDSSFVLVSETSLNRTTKFWLTGPNANTSEPFITNLVRPDNIKRTIEGNFWIAARTVERASRTTVPIAVLARGDGTILETIQLADQYGEQIVSEFNMPFANGARDFVGSPVADFIGIIVDVL